MTKTQLLEIFPELNYVADEQLRERCIATWLEVLTVARWEEKGIRNCSLGVGHVSESCPEKAIDHCRHVAQTCKAYCDAMGDWLKQLGKLDFDLLMADAVMHDVGKFLEYDYVDGKSCTAPNGKMFRHVVSGAYYAKKNGLPDEVVYAILAHSNLLSPEGGNAVVSMELTIMRALDHLTFKVAAINNPYES